MKFPKISRRKFICLAVCSVPAAGLAEAFLVEPTWVKVTNIDLKKDQHRRSSRIVHFTDIHYNGDQSYLEKVVRMINELSPDLVCFTGDIVENAEHLSEALDILAGIGSPLFGVPGNWEYWSGASFPKIAKCFKGTGGAWLVNESATSPDGQVLIQGVYDKRPGKAPAGNCRARVLLTHYPALVDGLGEPSYDLILAGHSHGGQCRIPFFGAVILPDKVGKYDRGLFKTPSGPLYVATGIGTSILPVRFGCRPEITLIEI